jgi:hypothetical protein
MTTSYKEHDMTQTISKPVTTPLPTDDLDALGDKITDDILIGSVASDPTTRKIKAGGSSAKYQPAAWSRGGNVD